MYNPKTTEIIMNKYIKPEIVVVSLKYNEIMLDLSNRTPEKDDTNNQFSKSRYVDFSSEDSDFGF